MPRKQGFSRVYYRSVNRAWAGVEAPGLQGLAIDESQELLLYVVNRIEGWLRTYDQSGNLLNQADNCGRPLSVAVCANQNVLVTNPQDDEVLVFNAGGDEIISTWKIPGVTNVASNCSSVYFTCQNPDRLLTLSFDGQTLHEDSLVSTIPGSIAATDQQIFVTTNDGVLEISLSDRTMINLIGCAGNQHLEFQEPCGISVDHHGFVYVADTYNDRIQKFTIGGKFVCEKKAVVTFTLKEGEHEVVGTRDPIFHSPTGICVTRSGTVFVANNSGQIVKLEPEDPRRVLENVSDPALRKALVRHLQTLLGEDFQEWISNF